jgi:hypothetical protein
LTDDHVPPEALFPKPRPSNLVTVPSCLDCNQGASKDDEYFRLMISMRHDTGDHPAVKRILPALYRSLEKPKKRGFRQAVFNSIRTVDIMTATGIYVGAASAYNVDLPRLDRVAARITRGLYFHESGMRVPEDFHVKAHSLDGFDWIDSSLNAQLSDMLGRVLNSTPPRILGENVFAYWFQPTIDNSMASLWVLKFYERVIFFAMVVPKTPQLVV